MYKFLKLKNKFSSSIKSNIYTFMSTPAGSLNDIFFSKNYFGQMIKKLNWIFSSAYALAVAGSSESEEAYKELFRYIIHL